MGNPIHSSIKLMLTKCAVYSCLLMCTLFFLHSIVTLGFLLKYNMWCHWVELIYPLFHSLYEDYYLVSFSYVFLLFTVCLFCIYVCYIDWLVDLLIALIDWLMDWQGIVSAAESAHGCPAGLHLCRAVRPFTQCRMDWPRHTLWVLWTAERCPRLLQKCCRYCKMY